MTNPCVPQPTDTPAKTPQLRRDAIYPDLANVGDHHLITVKKLNLRLDDMVQSRHQF